MQTIMIKDNKLDNKLNFNVNLITVLIRNYVIN